MADQLNLVFFPATYTELFASWNRYPRAVPFAGGTGLLREQGRQILELPPIILSLERLEELGRISRTERYLEIGAMVKFNQIIDLGKIVPSALRLCLENIAGLQLRNMATLGGNICFSKRRLDSSAALTALDAQFELRNVQSSRWISAPRFFSMPGTSAMNPQELLTRIRVPLDKWDYSEYKKFPGYGTHGKAAVFLAKTQKNVLSDIRIMYKTRSLWRDRNSESILIGKQLPLSRRVAADFAAGWAAYMDSIGDADGLSKREMISFIERNVYNLSE